jgi:putative ABC transport system substrate-binding protein
LSAPCDYTLCALLVRRGAATAENSQNRLCFAVLRTADSWYAATAFEEYEAASRVFNVAVHLLEERDVNPDLEGALQKAAKGRASALITVATAPLYFQRQRIADMAIKHRLPSMYEGSAWVEAGGLMSYSTKDPEVFRRAAVYVDKILKGGNPAELPVEQPTKFELVINLNTAKQIGLTIPCNVLQRAGRVIR